MKKNFVFLFSLVFSIRLFAQFTITGTVLTLEDKLPIENVNVIFQLEGKIVTTDSLGKFSIDLKENEEFILSHIAYDFVLKAPAGTAEDLAKAPNIINYRILMTLKNRLFQPVEIIAHRAENSFPVTFTNIKGSELNKNNFGEDLPFLLESTPSAVVTSDAGNGIGYTGIRIRGSDATRVNITINGVPYNDAESQQTYWVDLPDFASSIDDIQIQRGVGLSTYGVSSLGASVNIFTNNLSYYPFAKIDAAIGSFNLFKAGAAFGTGVIKEHWYFEGRVSKINSDGFVDRSFADLSSFFLTTSYKLKKYSSIVNIFSGDERTYQSWAGVPAEIIDTNRTYNPYTYENQTDNYTQTHYQWHNTWIFKYPNILNLTFNYSKGNGYYEQLEEDQNFIAYGAQPVIIGIDTIHFTDLITQKWLDNDYYGAYIQYSGKLTGKLNINSGAAYYIYSGAHFGKIIWSEFPLPFPYNYEWYNNNANKKDGNIFTQLSFNLEKLIFLVDAQLRNVKYQFFGLDGFGNNVEQNVDLLFFNPKAGITYKQNNQLETYIYFGKSGKEPNRDDYVESSPFSRPSPEILYNLEMGERLNWKGWQLMLNYYYMYYQDQLVLTGEINDVGAFTRTNIPSSYRTGFELASSKLFFNKLMWNANVSFSKNIIIDYVEYVDNWDTGSQATFTYHNTPLAFSPAIVGYNKLNYALFNVQNKKSFSEHTLFAGLTSKYVGKQYADNTGNENRSLDPYLVQDVSLNYQIKSKSMKEINFNFIVQNILNHQYESNAWVYRYIYEEIENQLVGYYPQAGINWVLHVNFSF